MASRAGEVFKAGDQARSKKMILACKLQVEVTYEFSIGLY